jgi:serine/threonine-protein kinase HipA
MFVLPYFRIALLRARKVLRQVEHAVSQWRHVGRSLGMSAEELDQFADAFDHEERAAAQQACR